MLIAHDSVLRRIPEGLDRRQQITLDGLRISADIIDIATTRLQQSLEGLGAVTQHSPEFIYIAGTANLDAWAIVDNAHRFSELLKQFPLIKQKLPQFQILYRLTTQAEAMRHYIQHVRNEVDNLAKVGASVWGSITWNLLSDFKAGKRTQWALSMGTFYGGNFAALGSFPENVTERVDNIQLHAGGMTMLLTNVRRKVEVVVRGLEDDIFTQAGSLPRCSSDMLFDLTMKVRTSLSGEDDDA